MEAVAHNKAFAKKVGIPQSVGKDFSEADKGRKFRSGGTTNASVSEINKQKTHHGSIQLPNVSLNKYVGLKTGGTTKGSIMKSDMKEDMKMDKAQDKAMIKKAFKQHDAQEHKGGKGTKLALKKGGMAMKKMAGGGMGMKETMGPRTMAMDVEKGSNKLTKFGESSVQKRGHTKGKNLGDSGKTVGFTSGMKSGGMCGGGKPKKMAAGGSASKRADGIASKGKTKGRFC